MPPSSPRPPALPISQLGRDSQACGGNLSGTLPPAPWRCSFLVPFALSPPACMLCRRAEADPDICGRKLQKHGLCAHEFCLFFANGLCQHRVEELGLLGFLPEDIRRTVDWAAQKHCFVCGESGATITCWEMSCERSFHLPCAVEGGCVTQFFFQYRSFCWEHRPEQAVEAAPEANTTCLICLEPVGDKKTHGILVCPACKHAWCHRGCIQGQAVRDGIAGFRCPLCRDRDAFPLEMLTMGIRIPFSLPSRDSHADEALLARHSRCDASGCLCPGGRQQADGEGSFCWEHRPEQAVEAAPEANTTCLICLEPVGDRKSYGILVCPVCTRHRQTVRSGAFPPLPGTWDQ
ncbi:PHD finger protein 7 isoform X2 [Chroicocephalus ridibundus]|uniref:PHD finger protein 7 isoform X2 n=1 Tax=Chroicocephalus ridibundus TaxID=1192867 RepID=UPI002FDD905A